jgi:hypothetical protein
MARAYLAKRLAAIGFAPAGPNGGWEQPFPIVGLTMKHPATWTFKTGMGTEASFAWWDEFIGASGVQDSHVTIDNAPVVFVGYIRPLAQWDDFRGWTSKGRFSFSTTIGLGSRCSPARTLLRPLTKVECRAPRGRRA